MESKMKVSKVRKTTFLLSQKESNVAQVRTYLCLFDKNQNKNAKTESPKKNAWESVESKFILLKMISSISHSLHHNQRIQKNFQSFKNKYYIMSKSPSSMLISVK